MSCRKKSSGICHVFILFLIFFLSVSVRQIFEVVGLTFRNRIFLALRHLNPLRKEMPELFYATAAIWRMNREEKNL